MTKLTKVVTDDNSITFRNEELDECYHTTSGAIDEALRKHVIPSEICNLAKIKDEVHISDICFGLGYNSIVAINEIKKVNPKCKVIMYAYENDMVILNEIKNIDFNDSDLNKIRDKIIIMIEKGIYEDEFLYAKLFYGDFREELKKVENDFFNVVYYDPFSPGKVPELWSKEAFSLLYTKCSIGCVLTTYSYARIVKDNLKLSGFEVYKGPCVGRRSPSTVAKK